MQYHNRNYEKFVTDQAALRFTPLRRPRYFITPGFAAIFLAFLTCAVFSFTAFAINLALTGAH
jgi:hypothetical protein